MSYIAREVLILPWKPLNRKMGGSLFGKLSYFKRKIILVTCDNKETTTRSFLFISSFSNNVSMSGPLNPHLREKQTAQLSKENL